MRKTILVTLLGSSLAACGDDRGMDGMGFTTADGTMSDGAGSDGPGDGEDGLESGGGGDDGTDGDGGASAGSDSAGDDGGSAESGDSGGDSGGGDPGDGPCGCGFPEFACDPGFVDLEGTGGPMPPLCGGGSGLSDDSPNECHGGNFGTGKYSDAASFCDYFVNRFRYLENECGNFNTVNLTVDSGLGSQAQAEADEVADGAYPTGKVTCGGSPCGPLDGPRFNLGSGASWLYIDGWDGNGNIHKDSMFTAAESDMIIQNNPLWTDPMGNPLYERHCQFTTEFANAIVYHYCNWDGMGVYGDPTTQPTRVGCGVAVDTDGITWRVVKLGA